MHEEFWQRRWARNEIAFHQSQINPYLRRYFPTPPAETPGRVLVPLCGKAQDLLWLAEQGWSVLGIELSETAVQAFFAEHGLTPEQRTYREFSCYHSGPLEIWCGNFFALERDDVADCHWLYDRAALIALPEPMRVQYAQHLSAVLPKGCQGLLIGLEYSQERMPGPPFSVAAPEVQALLAEQWTLTLLEKPEVLADYPRFQEHLEFLYEPVYQLEKYR